MKLFAKKSLGQHFLNSSHVLGLIIEASKIEKGETVLEIGPGTGVLTKELLKAGAKVIAVEKDNRAIEILETSFFDEIKTGSLKLVNADILSENDSIGSQTSSFLLKQNIKQYALIANIPYYITGSILEMFLEHGIKTKHGEIRPNRMVLLVQKEVAERIVAKNGKESILSNSVKVFGTPKIIAKVPPGAFTPPPTVDSAILSITNISADYFMQKNIDISKFFKILKAGFSHKRKFVVRNLESVLSKEEIGDMWKDLGLNPKIRAEDMKIENWLDIGLVN